eukprot:GFKZ01014317.1.p2 GENE.GFKZ01014317.1~~GFKZ01014317.1.p2  ORF type:complete len:168 (+),score=18.79 GFKZ01014317.1:204-707(+)
MSTKSLRPVIMCRSFCNSLTPSNAHTQLSTLPSNLRSEARKLLSAVSTARASATRATKDDSDDDDRRHAVLHTKHALDLYVRLVAKGNPPVHLSPNASSVLANNPDDSNSELAPQNPQQETRVSMLGQKLEPQNDVMRVLGDEVQQMKEDTFRANRQRVWMGWRGWF